MELISLLRVVRRWPGVIFSVMLVTILVLGFRLRAAAPVYEAQVKLQLTQPQLENVDLFAQYRSSNVRDDMTVARNNFVEVLQSREVYDRTSKQLGLQGTYGAYDLNVNSLRDSDFIYVIVRAQTPELAEYIANTQVNAAIEYYGEVRAKPATAVGKFLASELTDTEKEYSSAEEALAAFQKENGITSLESELKIYEGLLEQLQLDRSRRMIDGKETATVDTIIAKRRDELQRLVALQPMYHVLQENATQAHAKYQLLLDKYNEAVLKDNTIRAASFIQVVEPALAPLQPAPANRTAFLVLGLVASLGLGILLAFLLDYLTSNKAVRVLTPANAPFKVAE